MISNYFKIALRNILKQRTYSIINLVGLTIGITAFLLIIMYIQNELGYDKHIPQIERLYRCVEIQHPAGVDDQHVAVSMAPLGPALKEDFPEVDEYLRILSWGGIPITYEGDRFQEPFLVHADSSIFNLFGIELIRGDAMSALRERSSIVITEEKAVKYFGSVDSALGKILNYDDFIKVKVTGVMKNQPVKTHQRIEMIVPFQVILDRYAWLDGWGSNSMTTYIQLNENTDIENLESRFHEWLLPYVQPEDTSQMFELYLQPVKDIHLKSNHIKFQHNYSMGDMMMVSVFTVIALLIILIACINYINMAIARSFRRAKEVGIRKVLGANRQILMYQFLGESIILTVLSIVLSVLLVEILLPFFNESFHVELTLDFIGNPVFNLGLLAILIIVSLLSGSYPAFYLSRFRPALVLKGNSNKRIGGSGNLSKALVVFQFVISIALIISIAITYRQFHYALNKDMGFDYSHVLNITTYNLPQNKLESLKFELMQNPHVLDISQSAYVNGVTGSQNTIRVNDSASTPIACRIGVVDDNYFNMMNIPIVLGRNFDEQYGTDERCAIILNQATVDYFGWEDPLEYSFEGFWSDTTLPRKVIGVIRDYHYYSIHSKIEPAAYIVQPEFYFSLLVKIDARNMENTRTDIQNKWTAFFPGVPFDAEFAETILRNQYSDEADAVKMVGFFTILSILVSCLGLYGLTAFLIEQRKKEIGIRKVYGSNVMNIVQRISLYFLRLVLIAGIIASGVAWYFMDRALDNFAYHIPLSWFYFAGGVLAALILAFLTIFYHTVRAALSNPIDTLRYE